MMYKHNCIKVSCTNNYEDEDKDAYYCKPCKEENKAIAQKIDATIASKPRRNTMSALKHHDALPQAHGFTITKL